MVGNMDEEAESFEEQPQVREADRLTLDLGSWEGPLDLLLTLARAQKVDLREISILALVEQYLAFIADAKKLKLEIAADYLVMAAWLAYLKSRLLLPGAAEEPGPSAEDMALALAHRLRRLGLTAPGASLLLGIGALSGMLVGVLAHAGHIGAGALWWVVGGVLVVVFTLSRVPVYGPRHSVSSQVGAPLRVRNG